MFFAESTGRACEISNFHDRKGLKWLRTYAEKHAYFYGKTPRLSPNKLMLVPSGQELGQQSKA